MRFDNDDEIAEFKGYKELLAKTLPEGTRVSWSAIAKSAIRKVAAETPKND